MKMVEEEKIKKHNSHKYWKKMFRLFIIALIGLLILYLIIKGEQLFYFVVFKLISVLLTPFKCINDYPITNILSYLCVLFQIYLHIVLFRKCVLSLVFLLGGFFKKIFIYYQFKVWINFIITQITPLLNINETSQIFNYKNEFKRLKGFQKVFNQMVLTNNSFESKLHKFGSYLNEVMYFYQQFKSQKTISNHQLSQFNSNADNLISSLNTYLNYNQIEILFNFEYSKVLTHLNAELLNDLKHSRNAININIAPDFPIVLISPSKEGNDNNNDYLSNNRKKTLVVFCNQNAVCCELYHLSKDNINYYLSLPNTFILLWNYKGFGLRKEMTTFESIDYDTQRLANYIKAEFSPRAKVVIHGISIGGYAAVKLANALNDPKNVLLIADRTMGDIDSIVKTLPYGYWLSLFFKILFPKWLFNTSNVATYIKARNKIIFYDENDEIIHSSANLINNISYVYFNDILKKPIKQFIKKDIISISELPNCILNDKEIIDLKYEIASLANKTNLTPLFKKTFLQQMTKCPLDIFLMNFFIFGFPFNVFKELSYNSEDLNHNYILIPIHLQKIVNENKQEMSALLIKFISQINSIFVNINLSHNDISEEQLNTLTYGKAHCFYLKSNIQEQLINYFGYTKRLFCGHNGKLVDSDTEYIREYLESKEYIPVQNTNIIN